MALIKFTSGATVVTFEVNPDVPAEFPLESGQVATETPGGDIYVYKKGPERQRWFLNIPYVSASKYTELRNFIRDTIDYMRNTFTYTDADSTEHTVRLASPDVGWQQDIRGNYTVFIELIEAL